MKVHRKFVFANIRLLATRFIIVFLFGSYADAFSAKEFVRCTIEETDSKFNSETKATEDKLVRKTDLNMEGPFTELKPAEPGGSIVSYGAIHKSEKFNFLITLWGGTKTKSEKVLNDWISFETPSTGLPSSRTLILLNEGLTVSRFMIREVLPSDSTVNQEILTRFADVKCIAK